jgi:hypothetical protein
MGLIAFTPISDGTTAVAAQVNTPLQTIYNEFNGNIAAANLASNAVISSKLDPTVNPETRLSDYGGIWSNFVSTGLVWSIVSGLNGTMSVGVVTINGIRYPITAIASRAFTASKDTYVDVNNASTIVYTEVANNAASPALLSNSVRLAIGITSGAAITSFNVGQIGAVGPTVSSNILMVSDSNGVLIYPYFGQTLIGYRQITVSFSGAASTANQAVTGLNVNVITFAQRRVKITGFGNSMQTGGVNNTEIHVWDGGVGVSQISISSAVSPTANYNYPAQAVAHQSPGAASKSYQVAIKSTLANTPSLIAATTSPAFIAVELE